MAATTVGRLHESGSMIMLTQIRLRKIYFFTLTIVLAIVNLTSRVSDAVAQTKLSARLTSVNTSSGPRVHVTVRTQEGLERFVFSSKADNLRKRNIQHFSGISRTRNFQTIGLPAALSVTNRKGWLFFTSRRTGRPTAAVISFQANQSISSQDPRVRVSRVFPGSLGCGEHSMDPVGGASVEETTHTRRVLRSGVTSLANYAPAPFSPRRVMQVATQADFEFFTINQGDTEPLIEAIMNAVDVIYASSLGIRIKLTSQQVDTKGAKDTSLIAAEDLLDSFRSSRFISSTNADIRHLFTGRSIEGFTIGIAYVGSACVLGGRYAVGLSRSVSEALHPLLAAHEIAHNLGARHDDVNRSIMNPAITTSNDRFSDISINSIHDFVSTSAACISVEPISNVALALNPKNPEIFSARVSFVSAVDKTCKVTLYGSDDGVTYRALASRNVYSEAEAVTRFRFIADAPPISSPNSFTFNARVVCGKVTARSSSRRLRAPFTADSASKPIPPSRWLEQLRRNMN